MEVNFYIQSAKIRLECTYKAESQNFIDPVLANPES